MKNVICLALFFILPVLVTSAYAQSGIIRTIAGNGVATYSGDGLLATNASLNSPKGIWVDGAGNMYVADQANNRVRKVSVGTNIITTIAGNGTAGYSGDGGPATAASLNSPTSVFVDGVGNIYVADYLNNRVRRISAAGFISTVAGNGVAGFAGDGTPAVLASLHHPYGVCTDGAGGLVITDQGNNRLRRVLSSGIITTIAGTGAPGFSGDGGLAFMATFTSPSGICRNAAGSIYFSTLDERVRVINAAGFIQTFAGDGTSGTGGDCGLAVSAQINVPEGLALDASGNLYIATSGDRRIRKVIVSTGRIRTVAGSGGFVFSGDGGSPMSAGMNPYGVFVNSAGNIFISGDNRVRRVNISQNTDTLTICDDVGLLLGNPTTYADSVKWSTGATTPVVGPVFIGTYWVQYYVCGDIIADTFVLSPGTTPVVSLGADTTICAGASVTLSSSVSYTSANYLWSTGSVASSISVSTAGAYWLRVSVRGCDARDTVNVSVHTTPPPLLSGIHVYCQYAAYVPPTAAGTGVLWYTTPTGGTGSTTVPVITTSVTGVYTIYATQTTAGCESVRAPFTITVHPVPSEISGPSIICIGATALFTDSVAGGTWSSSNSGVATVGSSSGVVTGVSAGTAIITYMLPGGCYKTKTITVSASLPPITGDMHLCVGEATVLGNGVSGGTWTSSNPTVATIGSSSGMVTGLSVGTTIITYSVPGACGPVTAVVTVSPMPAPITGLSILCPGDTTTLRDSTAGGTWSSSNTGVATINPTTGFVTAIGPGITIITYTISGCSVTFVLTVNRPPGPILGVLKICVGETTALTDTVPGGTWTSGNTTVATVGSLTGVVTGISAGTAVITYTTICGAVYATVTVNPVPGPIVGLTLLCVGDTTIMTDTPSGGTWTSGTPGVATIGSTTGKVTAISPGTTVIKYTLPGGCFKSITVTVNPKPKPITGNLKICVGSATALTDTVTGGTWTSGSPGVATIGSATGIATGLSAGTTVITYTTICGSVYAILTVNPMPSIITGITTLCEGSTTTLSDSVAGGKWTSGSPGVATVGSSTGVVTGISVGTAAITYTLPGGCFKTITVTVNPRPKAITGPMVLCEGATTTLSDTVTGGRWRSGDTTIATIDSVTGVVTGISAGTVMITYANSCGFVTDTITVNPTPADIDSIPVLCPGITYHLNDSTPGGIWSSSNTGVATVGSSSGIVTTVATGVTTITYTLQPGGCYKTIVVTVAAIPAATGKQEICVGDTTAFSNSIPGGIWTSSDTAIATIGDTSGIATGISAGFVTISYTLSTGCITTATLTVHPLPDAGIITGDSTLCIGETILLTDTVSGGTWNYTAHAVTAMIDSTEISLTGSSAGMDTITYTVTRGTCTATVMKIVTVHALPYAGVIAGNGFACAGAVITLTDTVTGGTWSSSDSTVAIIDSITGLVVTYTAGTTTITFTTPPDSNGCISTATFTLAIGASPLAISGNVIHATCYDSSDGSISISVSGGSGAYIYSWSTGDSVTDVHGLAAGIYTVHVMDTVSQCAGADSFIVSAPDSIFIIGAVNNEVCRESNGSILLNVLGGTAPYTYLWSTNATGNEITNLSAGKYSIHITDINGCRKDLELTVEDTCMPLIIHNGLSPNGDGINDTWMIEGILQYPANGVQLFDKWGDMIFEQTNYRNDWDGKGKDGSQVPDGTYFYLVKINATHPPGGRNDYTGALLIKR